MNLSPDFGQLLKILVGVERLYHFSKLANN
jgi:hypothetical protein